MNFVDFSELITVIMGSVIRNEIGGEGVYLSDGRGDSKGIQRLATGMLTSTLTFNHILRLLYELRSG